jgi:hypothetical protein
MENLIMYFILPSALWFSLRKGFYDGYVYGLLHKKIGRKIGALQYQPYLYAGQAMCRGWSLILTVGLPFFLMGYLPYFDYDLLKHPKEHYADEYYVIYMVGYSVITGYIFFGVKWIREGYVDGMRRKKTKTYYHLQNGETYYINSIKEKPRKISKHKYFRGGKAYKTGVARVLLGSSYLLVALLLFIDRDYYVGSAKESLYPDVFTIIIDKYGDKDDNSTMIEKVLEKQDIKITSKIPEVKVEEFKAPPALILRAPLKTTIIHRMVVVFRGALKVISEVRA